MNSAKWALGIAAWLAASGPALAAARKASNPAAKALVGKAIQASDIEVKGSTPFRLEARIHVDLGEGQSENGKLALVWTPAGRWRREMQLLAYRSIEISDGKKNWTRRTTNYLPYQAFLTVRAVNLWDWLRRAKGQDLSGPQTSSQQAETCVTAGKVRHPTLYCFDSLSGNLARVVDTRWNLTIRYSEYAPFGARSFPRLIEAGRRAEKPFIEIRVVELAEVKKPAARLFVAPEGARQTPTEADCGKIEAAKLEKMVQPEYPPEAQKVGITGIVKLYAVIGADGIARGMWPVNASTPMLTGAAIQAVSQWRYEPRTCRPGGTRLPQIQLITILFSSR